MTGTTISASSTIGIELSLPSQNPVLVLSTGTIETTGSYAVSDTAPAITADDMITNEGVLQGQYAIEFNGPAAVGLVNNLGKIVGTAANAIYLQDEGDVNNGSATDTTATIATTPDHSAAAILFNPQPEGDDLIINYGTISAPQGGSDGVSMDAGQENTVINYGTVSGGSFGVVTSGAGPATITNGNTAYTKSLITGIFFQGTLQTGAVTNYGTISGPVNAAYGIKAAGSLTVTNLGTIIGVDNGIFAAGLGTITNSGSIVENIGGGPAIQLASGGSITNDTTATIVGGTGVILGYIGGTGPVIQTPSQVTNLGTIDGTDGDAISTNDTGPVTITNGSATDTKELITSGFQAIVSGVATLANFGTIISTSAGGAPSVDMGGGSSITNGSTSDTVATISGGVAINTNSGNSTLNNFGTIAASNGSGVGNFAGNLTNGSATDVKALITGSITGVIETNNGGTVTNFGTIIGAANDGVSLNSGTIVNSGTIEGGLAGIITGNGATIVNSGTIETSTTTGSAISFLTTGGTIVNDAGGLIGTTNGTLATVVNNGTIVAGNSGGLDIYSSIDPSSSGIFQLTGKSKLEIAAYLGTNLKIQFLGSTPTNELIVDNPVNFGVNVGSTAYAGPLLEGFTVGDEILLKGIGNPVLSYSTLTGELQLTSAGKPVATLLFQNSSLGAGTFHVTSESGNNYLITHS